MKKILFSIFIVAVFFGYACKSTHKYSTQTNETSSNCSKMLLLNKPLDSLRVDHFELDSISLDKNCLNIFVNYSGGCGDADFNLYYTQIVANSMPPQTALHLSFEDNDNCRSIVSKKLTFDLEPFANYKNGDGIYLILGENRILFK